MRDRILILQSLIARPRNDLAIATMTAPTGTSPRSIAARASKKAQDIGSDFRAPPFDGISVEFSVAASRTGALARGTGLQQDKD